MVIFFDKKKLLNREANIEQCLLFQLIFCIPRHFLLVFFLKIACLKDENHWLKCSSQKEINDLQRKLEYSSEVITRLQNESSKETSYIAHLKEQISNISKVTMEERVCEQRLLKARSIEEIDKLRDLDREKVNLERKLNEAKTALHGYSERLREKVGYL